MLLKCGLENIDVSRWSQCAADDIPVNLHRRQLSNLDATKEMMNSRQFDDD